MKTQLSSLDIHFLVKELSQLAGARIDKIYQIGDREFRVDLRAPDKKRLVVTPGYLCLTKYEHEAPEKPTSFSMSLRKRLSGGIVKSVEQHRFDRIVEITVEGRGKVIFELFSKGNVIVTDESGAITSLMEAQEWKDRILKVGNAYKYPPETPDIMGMPMNDVLMRLAADKEIVKALAADLGLGGTYANEVLMRAGVDPKLKANRDAALKAYEALKGMLVSKISAQIVVGSEGAVDAVPFEMEVYKDEVRSPKESFNEAIDEYFTNLRAEGKKGEAAKDYEKELQRVRIVIGKQKETIAEMEKDSGKFKEMGDRIYSHFQEIDAVLKGIAHAKKEGKNWMAFLKEKGLRVTNAAERQFEFDGAEVCVDKSVTDNASMHYEHAKKAKSKLEGARGALRRSEAELVRIEKEKKVAEKKVSGPVERHKPEWYEKFRWFTSSDGFLVIGGRDAASNEVLIKKHTEKNDLVFHSSVHGAPFFVVKNPEGKGIPEETKIQAAEAAASYSSAWTDELGSADVYAITPEQVSKTPESGEYLSRGAFVIRGEREWFRGMPLKVAIGFRIGDYALAIGGPEGAVKSQTKYYVNIGVGAMKSGELASAIKANILRRTGKDEGQKVKKVVLGEVQKWIPAGKGMLLK